MGQERIAGRLGAGVSVIVGSVADDGAPACCRAVGLRSDDDLATATIYVPVATSRETVANIAATRRLAVVATHPISHCATQLKGIVSETRLARDDEQAFIRTFFAGFTNVLNTIGYPPKVTKAVVLWPAFAIELRVEEVYEQSPGPRAGTKLR